MYLFIFRFIFLSLLDIIPFPSERRRLFGLKQICKLFTQFILDLINSKIYLPHQVHLLGHGHGGVVSTYIAGNFPHKIGSVVAVNGFCLDEDSTGINVTSYSVM